MIYLAATILLNTLLFALFKLFPRFGIDGQQAIAVNYITCVVTGCLTLGEMPVGPGSLDEPWLPWALLMGATFISLFNLMAWRTREDGMTTTTTANKLSLVIPVLFSLFLYEEHLGALKLAGIAAAFPAVYFTTKAGGEEKASGSLLFPAVLFVASGLLDTMVKYVEHSFLSSSRVQTVYTIHVFVTAALIGIIINIIMFLGKRTRVHWRNIVAGIILGVPNYFSIYFLIKLLHSDVLQSSAAIPVNNIGIVVLSAITAISFFREKLNWQRVLGLTLSVAAILMIALSDTHGKPI